MYITNIKKPGLVKGSETGLVKASNRKYDTYEDSFIAEYGEKTGTRTKYQKPKNNNTNHKYQSKTEEIIVTGKSKYEPKIEKLLLKRRKV